MQRARVPGNKGNKQMSAKSKKNLDLCGTCHKDVRRLRRQMIQCDKCDQWHHYVCVRVSAKSAEDIRFVCPLKCTPE